MSASRVTSVVALLILGLLVAACGNEGVGGLLPGTPSADTVSVKGVVYAPQSEGIQPLSAGGTVSSTRQEPLADASVIAYRLPEMQQVSGSAAKTDEDGRYVLSDLPADVPVVIVVSKEYGEGDQKRQLRLSTYIERPADGQVADIDVGTSLATEVLLQNIVENNGAPVSQTAFELMVANAQGIVEASGFSLEDVLVGNGVFAGKLGDGLDEHFEAGKDILLPDETDPGLVAAKLTVEVLRNAGMTLTGSTVERLMTMAEDFSEENAGYMQEVGFQIAALVEAPMWIISEELEPGRYRWGWLEDNWGDYYYYGLELIESMEEGWIIDDPSDNLVAKVFPYEGEGDYQYTVTLVHKVDDQESSFSMDYRVDDQYLGMDFVFLTDGQGELKGGQPFTFTFASLDGDGNLNFHGEVGEESDDLYLYGDLRITNASELLDLLMRDEEDTTPVKIDFGIEFDGIAKFPSSEIDGQVRLDLVARTVDDEPIVPRRGEVSAVLNERDNGETASFFEGDFEFEWANVDTISQDDENFIKGTISFDGWLYTPGRRDLGLSVDIEQREFGLATFDVAFVYAEEEFVGTGRFEYGSGDESEDGMTGSFSLTLTNEKRDVDLEIFIPEDFDPDRHKEFGRIMYRGEEVAVFKLADSEEVPVLIVEYYNSDFDTIP